jgi:hypothetical protein
MDKEARKHIAAAGCSIHEPYQQRVAYIISFLNSIVASTILLFPFLEQNPLFFCGDTYCKSPKEACAMKQLDIDRIGSPQSITLEFGLFCDDA